MKTILITGGTGRIGSCIAAGLNETGNYTVLRGTRQGSAGDLIHLDYQDSDQLEKVFRQHQVDVIIHMAYHLGNDHFLEIQIDQNLKNAYYLYEAARKAGVKRVIFGSSNHVFGFYQKGDDIRSDSACRPDSPYALSKVFVETLGRYYSDRYGLSVFNIRIGNFGSNGNLEPRDLRASKVWLSNEDCVQLMKKLIEYDEDCKYLQMFGMSANDGCYYDTSDNSIVGYVPEKNGAVYREKLKALPARLYNNTGIPVDVLTRHNYVGGYNNSMNIDGSFDLDYLKKLGEDYIPED